VTKSIHSADGDAEGHDDISICAGTRRESVKAHLGLLQNCPSHGDCALTWINENRAAGPTSHCRLSGRRTGDQRVWMIVDTDQ
jgi:hypothetical protein